METCEHCEHSWHGLPCQYRNERYEWATNTVNSEVCDCQTSFKYVEKGVDTPSPVG